jgi:hypothetical protein
MPRLWIVDPATLCRQHLVAEHHESHVFLGKLKLRHKLDGYISAGLFALDDLRVRHEAVVAEMERRGMQHKTPFPAIDEVLALGAYLSPHPPIDPDFSLTELHRRCPECRQLWETKYAKVQEK